MKIFCENCGQFATITIEPLTLMGDQIQGNIICACCDSVITTLRCDEDEFEMDPDPEGYYALTKITNYYPNGG